MKRGHKAIEKLTENVKIICLQTPIWKVSCHRSIISCLLGSFNGKCEGFSMVCSESELKLVELFTFPGKTKSLRKVKLGQLAWSRLRKCLLKVYLRYLPFTTFDHMQNFEFKTHVNIP